MHGEEEKEGFINIGMYVIWPILGWSSFSLIFFFLEIRYVCTDIIVALITTDAP